jgi:hypothetical protein
MNPPPNAGPEPQGNANAALALADEILRLTGEILDNPALELPELNRAVLRRGQLLGRLNALDLEGLSGAEREAVQTRLEACQALEARIEAQMAARRDELGDQLRDMKDSKALLDKYRVGGTDEPGTRTEQA